jgi:reactive intermediate/imine deaminase
MIALDPATGQLVASDVGGQAERVFASLAAIASAAGGSLANAVKVTIYLTDLASFGAVNEQMKRVFREPYPARATVGVKELPRGAAVEIDAVLYLD